MVMVMVPPLESIRGLGLRCAAITMALAGLGACGSQHSTPSPNSGSIA